MFRQALALIMSMLLTVPLWAISSPIGTVSISSGATVAGTLAAPGTSLFSGDTVAVQPNAKATVTLSGGSRVLFDANSQARLVRDGSVLALELNRGGAAFTSSAKSLVEGRMLDVTFRPENPAVASVGYITFKDSKHALLYADKGAWLVTTGHDGHSIVLQPGHSLEGTVAPVAQSTNDQQNNKKNKKKWAIFWIGSSLAGAATGLALAFGKSECTLQGGGNGYNPSCTISPVTPNQVPQ
jgi:hypothetical protein